MQNTCTNLMTENFLIDFDCVENDYQDIISPKKLHLVKLAVLVLNNVVINKVNLHVFHLIPNVL